MKTPPSRDAEGGPASHGDESHNPVQKDPFNFTEVGTWIWDVQNDRVISNNVTAALFGVEKSSETETHRLGSYEAAIHPDDRDRFRQLIELSLKDGRFFVAEYRTVPRPGEIYWVLAGGTFTPDESGSVARGAGILIDITTVRRAESLKDERQFSRRPPDMDAAINIVANRALDLWEAAQWLEPDDYARIKPLLECLLFEMGTQLAKTMGEEFGPKLH